MEIKTRWAQDKNGKVIPFATVSLFYEGTTDLVEGLETKDGGPLSNPFQSDVNGKAVFAAPDGQYDIKFSSGPRESTASIQFLDVSGALQVVENIDALRSIAGNSGRDYIAVKFHTADGDGGGGNFYWEAGAAPGTYVDNGGTVIVPNGGDGSSAWVRVFSGGVYVEYFGAKGDSVSNDSTAVQKAVDYCSESGDAILFSKSKKYLASGIQFSNGNSYLIIGEESVIDAGGADCFLVDGATLNINSLIIEGADDAILYTSASVSSSIELIARNSVIRNSSRAIEADRAQPAGLTFSSITIDGCEFTGNYIDVVFSTAVIEKAIVSGSRFSDGGPRALVLSSTSSDSGDHLITGNIFNNYSNDLGGTDADGQFMRVNGKRVVIDGNIFDGLYIIPPTTGSDTEGIRSSASEIIVSNNVFKDAGMAEAVVALKSGRNAIVTGNIFECSDEYNTLAVDSGWNTRAILAKTNSKISNNTFINFGGTCVDTPDSGPSLGTVEISDNLFVDCECGNYSGNTLLRLGSVGTKYIITGNVVKTNEASEKYPQNIFRTSGADYYLENNDFYATTYIFTNLGPNARIFSNGNTYRNASRLLSSQSLAAFHSRNDRYVRTNQPHYSQWLGASGSCRDLQIDNLYISWINNSLARFIGVAPSPDAVGFMRGEFTFRDSGGAAVAIHHIEVFIKRLSGTTTVEETVVDKFHTLGSPTLTKADPSITSGAVAFDHPSGGSSPAVEGVFSLQLRAVSA